MRPMLARLPILMSAGTIALGAIADSPAAPAAPAVIEIEIDSAEQLQRTLAEPLENTVIRLAPGEYHLEAEPYTDPTCGNCPDPAQPAEGHLGRDSSRLEGTPETTIALHIRGRNLTIAGPEDRSAIIHTNAGYGLLIESGEEITVENLTITGGKRSEDSNATDGAILVRSSTATIRNNRIRGNLGDQDVVRQTVSGVSGIVGREDSDIRIIGNEIIRNSWDGIALYRGARAVIENNVIDGIDMATGATLGGGRGVGIGITWDARAEVRGNLVRRYWKGIGLFVNARATLENNIVEHIATWGIALWDAGGGEPHGTIRGNVVFHTGACGASITSRTGENPGEFVNNAIVRAAQDHRYDPPDRYCLQCALALHRAGEEFRIGGNHFFDNRRADDEMPDHDVPEDAFREAIRPLLKDLSAHEALRGAAFLAEFGREETGRGERGE